VLIYLRINALINALIWQLY